MESLFGKKKSRPRQPSVSTGGELRSMPYDRVPPGSPLPIGSSSQGFRSAVLANAISAPITNPTLTTNGTDLNLNTIQRVKAERDLVYAANNVSTRPNSPQMSLVTDDSSTLYSDSAESPSKPYTPTARRLRQSESSGRRSPSLVDFGQYPSPTSPHPPLPPQSASSSTMRPSSTFTTRSDGNRASRYAPSVAPSESHSAHSHFPHFHRHGPQDDFYFPRPESDAEIEALFENIMRTREIGSLPSLSIDQKWHMVESDERIRWKEEKMKEEQSKKQQEMGKSAPIDEGTPEWYLRKFLDKTITAKQASSLLVSLRSKEVGYVCHT